MNAGLGENVRSRLDGELLVLLGLLGYGALYTVIATGYRMLPLTDPGPGFLPTAFGLGLVASCVVGLLGWRRHLHQVASTGPLDETADDGELVPGWTGASRPLAIVVVLFLFPYVAPTVGFMTTAWIVFVLCAQILQAGHIVATLATATVVVSVSYVVFVNILNVPLPSGLAGF